MNTPNIPRELVGTAQAVGIGIEQSLDTAVPHAARCQCYEAGYVEMCDEMRTALLHMGLWILRLDIAAGKAEHAIAIGVVPVSELDRGQA